MIARIAPHAPSIAPFEPSSDTFYFVDGPQKKAKAERGGLSAKEANCRLRLTLRILAAENARQAREKRIADLAYFYAEAQQAGIELSPFDNE